MRQLPEPGEQPVQPERRAVGEQQEPERQALEAHDALEEQDEPAVRLYDDTVPGGEGNVEIEITLSPPT